MIIQETFSLHNGVQIPKLGLGTWFINNKNVVQAVQEAVQIGYRHIDTAQAYQNETGVGEGVRASGFKREGLFITTKLAAEIKSYENAVASIDGSLAALGLDYIDLMIIHSPKPWAKFKEQEAFFEGNREAWRALERAYKEGKLRSIGLSNFQQEDIDNIISSATVKPMVNQILAHISNTPHALIEYCKQQDILVEAYSPIGHGELLKNDEIKNVAEKYGVSIAQLSIRYCLQLGLLPLPKTANPEHMRLNATIDFIIADEDMQLLKDVRAIEHYGEAARFPVFAAK